MKALPHGTEFPGIWLMVQDGLQLSLHLHTAEWRKGGRRDKQAPTLS